MLALHPSVVDAVWTTIEARVPDQPPDIHRLGCRRRRVPDRVCFEGILVRLVTGCSWDVAARIVHVGETTLRRRRDQWVRAGWFGVLAREALEAYDRVIGLDLSDVAIDGSQHKAPAGGEGTGKNPGGRPPRTCPTSPLSLDRRATYRRVCVGCPARRRRPHEGTRSPGRMVCCSAPFGRLSPHAPRSARSVRCGRDVAYRAVICSALRSVPTPSPKCQSGPDACTRSLGPRRG